jgi:hypothetical protein
MSETHPQQNGDQATPLTNNDILRRVGRCVTLGEDEEGMRPRSQPQTFMGPGFLARAPNFAVSQGP